MMGGSLFVGRCGLGMDGEYDACVLAGGRGEYDF